MFKQSFSTHLIGKYKIHRGRITRTGAKITAGSVGYTAGGWDSPRHALTGRTEGREEISVLPICLTAEPATWQLQKRHNYYHRQGRRGHQNNVSYRFGDSIAPLFGRIRSKLSDMYPLNYQIRSRVWRHTAEQCVAACTLRRYSSSLRSAYRPGRRQACHAHIPQIRSPSDATTKHAGGLGMVQSLGFRIYRIRWAESFAGCRATCPWRRSWRSRNWKIASMITYVHIPESASGRQHWWRLFLLAYRTLSSLTWSRASLRTGPTDRHDKSHVYIVINQHYSILHYSP